ncbi:MAG: O-antigen translocase [Candidatus Moranbacteria bacterium GW2011_GWD2_37_9]|uniref:O-antigen translocase n=1 Tax=Candidatus Nomurabacteria bacterium GW2011_GWE1_35_16 TaxID=1618761 RepID=A0A0G0EF65_9BACT|nr:MAG: O-antigen translocase [Candidatus Nomurabacteria bacterium GW2011_GWE1_35_16]KKQ47576.1 MAG: O-antigen translocase [Candidatus Moranbacteria bacterium GW2011_GWD2_37_9]
MRNILNFIKSNLSKYIGQSRYKKNILILVGGRVLAQGIPILLTPIFTRIYSPEEYGVFAVYSTIISIIAMISNGRYCLAIMLPKEEKEARGMVLISMILPFVVSIFSLIILLIFNSEIFALLNVAILSKYIWLIVGNILFIALYEALFYYELRQKHYKILSRNAIIQAFVLVSTRLLLGFTGFTEVGLGISYFLSYVFPFILLSINIFNRGDFNFQEINRNSLKKLLGQFSNFPKYTLWADSLQMVAQLSPNIFLNKIFGSITTGYYSMSDKILGSPIWLITASIGDVFKQEASEQYRKDGNCHNVFMKTSKALFFIGIIPFILIYIFLPSIITFILGSNWAPVGEYIRILSLMYFARFVVGPVSYVVNIVGKNKIDILFQSLKFIAIIISFVMGFYYKNLTIGLILWSLLTTLAYVVIYLVSNNLAKTSIYDNKTENNFSE